MSGVDAKSARFETVAQAQSPDSGMGCTMSGANKKSGRAPWVIAGLTAAALVVAIIFGAYAPSLGVGFLLDDFSHLDYVYLAQHGDWSRLTQVFIGNWTGAADNLTSYRPFISLSFCLDYLVWHLNATGYHVTNLILFSACAILAGLIGSELLRIAEPRFRLFTAVSTGLLFAVYPLHPEAVTWIVGRVDPQCGMFYLSSLYAYMLYRRHPSPSLLALSAASFFCSLLSKEMSVTLPAVLTAAELILPKRELGWATQSGPWRRKIAVCGGFWAGLAVFLAVRSMLLGTAIGGYGGGSLKTVLHSFLNFADAATFLKALFGTNEEVIANGALQCVGYSIWILLAVLAVARLKENSAVIRTFAFLFVWIAVSALPTFQIWHVFPNLSGSRLLYLPSVPLCIAVSMLALLPPAIFQARSSRKVALLAGGLLLTALFSIWLLALQINQMPWVKAGQQMRSLIDQVREIASRESHDKLALLVDLPQDYQGAGMLGRPEFLEKILRPPLAREDKSSSVVTAERCIAGSHEFMLPGLLTALSSDPSVDAAYIWNRETGHYIRWHQSAGAAEFHLDEAGTISGGNCEAALKWLTLPKPINPLAARAIILHPARAGRDAADLTHTGTQWQLLWRSENQPASWIDYSEGPTATVVDGDLVFEPSRYRSWLLNGPIVQIALKATGASDPLEIASIAGRGDVDLMPVVRIAPRKSETALQHVRDRYVYRANAQDAAHISIEADASKLLHAQNIIVYFGKTGFSLPDTASSGRLDRHILAGHRLIPDKKGKVTLTSRVLKQPGIHAVTAIALDEHDQPTGFAAEPIYIDISPAR